MIDVYILLRKQVFIIFIKNINYISIGILFSDVKSKLALKGSYEVNFCVYPITSF